jgi:hypothetical protein
VNARVVIIGGLILLCVLALVGVRAQRSELAQLRADQQQAFSQLAASSNLQADVQFKNSSAIGTARTTSLELLKLRSTVTQLIHRRNEIAGVSKDNENLRSQIATRGTNASPGLALPADYIRASQAQWVGLATPENTIQSFFWSVRNRDMTNLLQTLNVASNQQMLHQIQTSPDIFFDDISAMPGMRIVKQQPLPDGSYDLTIEVVPGEETAPTIHFELIDGQWKMDFH